MSVGLFERYYIYLMNIISTRMLKCQSRSMLNNTIGSTARLAEVGETSLLYHALPKQSLKCFMLHIQSRLTLYFIRLCSAGFILINKQMTPLPRH